MNPVRHNLVALGSAAVLTVYGAGYLRTEEAASRFAAEDAERARPRPELTDQPEQPVATMAVTQASDSGKSITIAVHSAPDSIRTSPRTKAAVADTAKVVAAIVRAIDSAPPPQVANTTVVAVVTPPPALQGGNGATVADTAQAPRAEFRDGSYSGWGTSRHGDIQATVEIHNGRIVSATISQCLTRYSCSWISALPGQVVARQSANVDYVSGATQSTNAFYYAIVEALNKAK